MTEQKSERLPLLSPHRKYGVDVDDEDEEDWFEDAVTEGIWRLCNAWTFMFGMWYLSFLVKIGEVVFRHHIHVSFVACASAVFVPMWVGSIGGIAMIARGTKSLCGCHKNLRIVSKDYRAYLQRIDANTQDWIAFESLPLLRLYYLWSVLSVLSILCVVLTQLLWYLWLVEGSVGRWQACIPVGFLCLGVVVYVALIKSITPSTAACLVLVGTWLILVFNKLQEARPSPGEPMPSTLTGPLATAPLIIVQVVVYWKLISIVRGFVGDTIRVLSGVQWLVWLTYFFASLCCSGYIWMTLCSPSPEHPYNIISALVTPTQPVASSIDTSTTAMCWLVIVTLFLFGFVTTIRLECYQLSRSKGYSSPIPLVKNAIGTFEPCHTYRQLEFSIVGTLYKTQTCPEVLTFTAMAPSKSQSTLARGKPHHSGTGSEAACDNNMVYDEWKL
mmetsp:Transcript_19907/g.37038  ORF Transcript_19907/g.37038 Transcript_19907/m.37038 type:complete len:443 (-) Transcript_19907:98-1426(-)